jgi:hypothetical protein
MSMLTRSSAARGLRVRARTGTVRSEPTFLSFREKDSHATPSASPLRPPHSPARSFQLAASKMAARLSRRSASAPGKIYQGTDSVLVCVSSSS